VTSPPQKAVVGERILTAFVVITGKSEFNGI
jgi:hypothetical protein